MKRKTIEHCIQKAVNKAPRLDFDVLVNTPYVKMTEHDYITKQLMSQKNKL